MSNVVSDRIAALLIDIRKTHTQRIVSRWEFQQYLQTRDEETRG